MGVNLHHHLEQNLNQLEQTINIMNASALKKNFIVYSPQILTTENLITPLKLLMRHHNYEIELHDMLLTADSAEDLLAYRKADLIFLWRRLTTVPWCVSLMRAIRWLWYAVRIIRA